MVIDEFPPSQIARQHVAELAKIKRLFRGGA